MKKSTYLLLAELLVLFLTVPAFLIYGAVANGRPGDKSGSGSSDGTIRLAIPSGPINSISIAYDLPADAFDNDTIDFVDYHWRINNIKIVVDSTATETSAECRSARGWRASADLSEGNLAIRMRLEVDSSITLRDDDYQAYESLETDSDDLDLTLTLPAADAAGLNFISNEISSYNTLTIDRVKTDALTIVNSFEYMELSRSTIGSLTLVPGKWNSAQDISLSRNTEIATLNIMPTFEGIIVRSDNKESTLGSVRWPDTFTFDAEQPCLILNNCMLTGDITAGPDLRVTTRNVNSIAAVATTTIANND